MKAFRTALALWVLSIFVAMSALIEHAFDTFSSVSESEGEEWKPGVEANEV